jgi:hypothetical protein
MHADTMTDAEAEGVGDTGLTKEEEFLNRERKYSVNGVDVRKFSTSSTGGWKPQADPYYGRAQVSSTSAVNVTVCLTDHIQVT